MRPLLDGGQAHQYAARASAVLRTHAATPVFADLVAWIEALIVQQQTHMVLCARERLGDAQVRLKQLMALRAALVEPGGAVTGHVFD